MIIKCLKHTVHLLTTNSQSQSFYKIKKNSSNWEKTQSKLQLGVIICPNIKHKLCDEGVLWLTNERQRVTTSDKSNAK